MTAYAATSPVPAGIYRWTDAEGRTHFADRTPDGVDAEWLPHDQIRVDRMPALSAAEHQRLARFEQKAVQRNAAQPQAVSSKNSGSARLQATCRRIEERIEWINSRRRAGVTAREGEWLREERRGLEQEYRELQCLRLRDSG